MRYIAAYLLLRTGGKHNPSIDDVRNVLKAGEIPVDETKLNKFFSDLKSSGKTIDELIAAGSARMSALGGGGGGAAAAASSGTSAPATTAVAEPEPAKEPSAESEEEEVEMGGFFDDF